MEDAEREKRVAKKSFVPPPSDFLTPAGHPRDAQSAPCQAPVLGPDVHGGRGVTTL